MLLDFFVKGGVVMYPLLFCFLAALAVIVERLLFYLDLSRVERGQSERINLFAADWPPMGEKMRSNC